MIETMCVKAGDGVAAGVRYRKRISSPEAAAARSGSEPPERPSTPESIIFVHGVGSTAAIWDYQLRDLCDRYDCYAIELRGNGAIGPPPDPSMITRAGFVNDVLAVADAADSPHFHFVGCSLGGVVGFELWQHVPEQIASLTVVGSFAKYPNSEAYVANIEAAVGAAESMELFAEERSAKLGLPLARLAETLAQMSCKTIPSYLASTRATWTGDYRAMLSTISVPTLVICGERDRIAPLPLSQEIAAGIPGARLEVLPGAGHVSNADTPAAFNKLLREFLATTPL